MGNEQYYIYYYVNESALREVTVAALIKGEKTKIVLSSWNRFIRNFAWELFGFCQETIQSE